ncbi:MAG: hypothetical protein ACOYU4_09550 [Thermodesulfobacteriota bacterium]
MIGRHFICFLVLVLLIGGAACTTTPERRDSISSGIAVSVESGQEKSGAGEGEQSLEDISNINKNTEEESEQSTGVIDKVKSFLFKLKVPF